MDFITKPLPRQPLIGPPGARLVLSKQDADYRQGSTVRGRWFDNVEVTEAKEFLRAINTPDGVDNDDDAGDDDDDESDKFMWFEAEEDDQTSDYEDDDDAGDDDDDVGDDDDAGDEYMWSTVVLMPEEYKLRVGAMSLIQLQSQLEKYWGRGAIPGTAGYQDLWIPAWAPENIDDPYDLSWATRYEDTPVPRLDPALFSCWVNRESSKWLSYFIAKNHTFGVVHAWFAAFLGVIQGSLVEIAENITNMKAISHLNFRMSFDLCIKDYDETINGIPSLPLDTKITTHNGMPVIIKTINDMFPRRIWDICANTVIPATWFCGPFCPLTGDVVGTIGVTPVSHAWAANDDLAFILTDANQKLWPIPLPRGVELEDIREEMIRLGVRYVWLDVLCLRQQGQPALAKDLALTASQEVMDRREQCRQEEWKVDVPTIGAIYSNQSSKGLYGAGPIVVFLNGLGRSFRAEGWTDERHWFKRVWTLQETPNLDRCLIGGLNCGTSIWVLGYTEELWPWKYKVYRCPFFLLSPFDCGLLN